ncbi:MAG: hypothetical protein AB7P12_09880 [Alphaproteobacteria bacterium]
MDVMTKEGREELRAVLERARGHDVILPVGGAGMDYIHAARLAVPALLSALDAAEATIARLTAEVRQPFRGFYMDGRNEHGTHLLWLPLSSGGGTAVLDETDGDSGGISDGPNGTAERLFAEAEHAGHGVGHAIVITLRLVEHECGDYYECGSYSPELTAAFYGTAENQNAALAAFLEARKAGKAERTEDTKP